MRRPLLITSMLVALSLLDGAFEFRGERQLVLDYVIKPFTDLTEFCL